MIVIGGVPYVAAGRGSVPSTPAFTTFGTYVFARSLALTPPYIPPSGWGFVVSPAFSSGFSFLQQNSYYLEDEKIMARYVQFGNSSTSATTQFLWQLVKVS